MTPSPQPPKEVTRRRFAGTVVPSAMAKTCVIVVERRKWHPKYRKSFRVRRKFKVHDPDGIARPGDRVIVEECRPISREKRWRLIGKLQADSPKP